MGLELKSVLDALMNPFGNLGKLGGFAARIGGLSHTSSKCAAALQEEAVSLGKLIATFGSNVERLLKRYQESIFDRQYQLGRVADAAIELYVSSCVLNRLDRLLREEHSGADGHASEAGRTHDLKVGRFYLLTAVRSRAPYRRTCGTTTTTKRPAWPTWS